MTNMPNHLESRICEIRKTMPLAEIRTVVTPAAEGIIICAEIKNEGTVLGASSTFVASNSEAMTNLVIAKNQCLGEALFYTVPSLNSDGCLSDSATNLNSPVENTVVETSCGSVAGDSAPICGSSSNELDVSSMHVEPDNNKAKGSSGEKHTCRKKKPGIENDDRPFTEEAKAESNGDVSTEEGAPVNSSDCDAGDSTGIEASNEVITSECSDAPDASEQMTIEKAMGVCLKARTKTACDKMTKSSLASYLDKPIGQLAEERPSFVHALATQIAKTRAAGMSGDFTSETEDALIYLHENI